MPPKTRTPSYDPYAASRCGCRHLVYADDRPGGECRWPLCNCADHRPKGSEPVVLPERCPGLTCQLGRAGEWITGQGGIDGQHYDLPPGHVWVAANGGYVGHAAVVPVAEGGAR